MKTNDPTTWDSYNDLDPNTEQSVELLQDLALLLIEHDADYSVDLKLSKSEMQIFNKNSLIGSVSIEDSGESLVYCLSLEGEDDRNFDYADDAFDCIVDSIE